MSNVNSIKNTAVKANRNWGRNRPIVSSKPGEYAYLSPLIREICVQCKDLNVYIMNIINGMDKEALENTTLADLNNYHPNVLRRVLYDQTIYNKLIEQLTES